MAFNRDNWYFNSGDTNVNATNYTIPLSAISGDAFARGISNILTVGGLPTITGLGYPSGTLYSTQTRQWYADGVPVAGETGSTYVVKLNDIGRIVGQGPISGSKTIWHPRDIPGVCGVYTANSGILNASGVPCVDGEAVLTWMDQSYYGYNLFQNVVASRPLAQINEIANYNTVQFDAVNDYFNFPTGAYNNFRNRSNGYIVAGVSDINRTGGTATHYVAQFTTPSGGTASRIALVTRGGGDNFRAQGKTFDTDAGVSSASVASADGYFVLTNEMIWNSGIMRLRRNGSQPGLDTNLVGTGNTTDTPSSTGNVGVGNATSYFPGHISTLIFASPTGVWTPAQRSQIERFVGMGIGVDVPLTGTLP